MAFERAQDRPMYPDCKLICDLVVVKKHKKQIISSRKLKGSFEAVTFNADI